MALKISEDVSDQEWLQAGLFQRGEPQMIIDGIEQGTRGREEVIEDTVFLIKYGFNVRNPAVPADTRWTRDSSDSASLSSLHAKTKLQPRAGTNSIV